MNDSNYGVLENLAGAVGSLACVVSRKAILQGPKDFDVDKLAWQCVEFQCLCCDDMKGMCTIITTGWEKIEIKV